MAAYRVDLAINGRDLADVAEFAALGEASGFRGAWVSEVNGADAVTQVAAIIGATSTIRAGTAIVPIQTRDPLLMAQTAASLSDLSGGRFVLGLGTSTKVIVEEWHGRPWGKPVSGTREYVSLVRSLLAGERVSADGPYPMRRATLAGRLQREVPIHLAALNDGMLRLAAELGDGVILNFISPAQVKRAVQLMREVREQAGITRPFEVSIYFRATVTTAPDLALPRYQQELLTYLMAPVYQKFFAQDGHEALAQSTVQLWTSGQREAALAGIPLRFIAERALIGTPAEIHSRLAEYADAGMDTAFLLPVPLPGTDYGDSCREMIRALAPATA